MLLKKGNKFISEWPKSDFTQSGMGTCVNLCYKWGGKSEEHVCNHQQEWGDEPTIDEP